MDTKLSRHSAMGEVSSPEVPWPIGSIPGQEERQMVTGIYSGILFTLGNLFKRISFTDIEVLTVGFTYLTRRSIIPWQLKRCTTKFTELHRKEIEYSDVKKIAIEGEVTQQEASYTSIDKLGSGFTELEKVVLEHTDVQQIEVSVEDVERLEVGFTNLESLTDNFSAIERLEK